MKPCFSNNCLDLRGMKIYLDMDGVVADFINQYLDLAKHLNIKYNGSRTDNTANPALFRIAVLEHEIFRNLSLMPHAQMLIDYLIRIQNETGLEIEMLTSVNSYSSDIVQQVSLQKNDWLKKNNILWKVNFVKENVEKSKYASPSTLLIDDNQQCIQPFLRQRGFAIHYNCFDEAFINDLILTLKTMHAFKDRKVS